MFGMNSYSRTIKGEQPDYAGEQVFLKKQLMNEFANLKLEGVSTQPSYFRDAVKKVTQDFLENRQLEKLKPETIAYIAKKCADNELSFEAIVAQTHKSLFQAPKPYPFSGNRAGA